MERAEKPYPYAQPKTFAFIKEAVAEGAHLIVPKRLMRYSDAEDVWIKERNIAGIYFSSGATIYDIGEMYRLSGERVSQIVERFTKYLWLNSSLDIRAKYRLSEIKIPKPHTERSMFKRSDSRGGHLREVHELDTQGKSIPEISRTLGLPIGKVKLALKNLGKRG